MTGDKKKLRKELDKIVKEISAERCKEENSNIVSAMQKLPEFLCAENVFIYCSTKYEPDTYEIIEFALNAGKKVAVPKITGNGKMYAAFIESLDELVPDIYGIPAPKNDAKMMHKNDIDLMIVPGAAFAADGSRLGRGGGYYDRFMTETVAYKVGIVWSELFFDSLPTENHDVSVNCIITGNKIARLC